MIRGVVVVTVVVGLTVLTAVTGWAWPTWSLRVALVLAILVYVCATLEYRRLRRIVDAGEEVKEALLKAYAATTVYRQVDGFPTLDDVDRFDAEVAAALVELWDAQERPSAWVVRQCAPLLRLAGCPVEAIRYPGDPPPWLDELAKV